VSIGQLSRIVASMQDWVFLAVLLGAVAVLSVSYLAVLLWIHSRRIAGMDRSVRAHFAHVDAFSDKVNRLDAEVEALRGSVAPALGHVTDAEVRRQLAQKAEASGASAFWDRRVHGDDELPRAQP